MSSEEFLTYMEQATGAFASYARQTPYLRVAVPRDCMYVAAGLRSSSPDDLIPALGAAYNLYTLALQAGLPDLGNWFYSLYEQFALQLLPYA